MGNLKLLVVFFLVITFPISLAFADGWIFEVPYVFTQEDGMSLALDSGDNPHISFCEYTDGCLLYATKTDSTWDIYNIDDDLYPYHAGPYNDIAVDEEDNPHISYNLYNEAVNHLKYKYYNGSSWYSKIVDSGGVGLYTSIDVDGGNNPHISYYDESNGNLKYAYSNGSTWEITTVDYIGDVGKFTSIALDDENKPHIAYYDVSNCDLKYACWNGSTWEITAVYYIGNYGSDISLALDDDNNPHISYFDRSNSDLKYSYWNGFNWETSTVDNTSGTPSHSNSLALDDGNKPRISYESVDGYEYYFLKYARWTGSSWDITEVDTGEYYDPPGLDISMAIDSYNNPHISYCMWEGSKLKYAFYSGAPGAFNLLSPGDGDYVSSTPTLDWEDSFDLQPITYDLWYSTNTDFNPHEEINDLTESTYTFPSGVLQGGGTIYYWKVRAWDGSEETWSGPDEYWSFHVNYTDINLLYFSAEAGGGVIALDWSVETTPPVAGGEQISGFNLYRHELVAEMSPLGEDMGHRLPIDDWLKVNDHLITGQNPYSYTDTGVESGVAYEYKLEAVLDSGAETLGTTQATAGLPTSFAILALYPNPATDTLTCLLALPSAGAVELALYDISGRLVIERRIEATEPSEMEAILDVSGLASGVYTLRASMGNVEVSPACGGGAVVVR